MQTNNELAKLFLNIEKQLIDFRIQQIDNGSVSYVGSSISKEDLKDLIKEVVKEQLSSHKCSCHDKPTGEAAELCDGNEVAHTVDTSLNVSQVSSEDIASKVMEAEQAIEVPPEEVKIPVETVTKVTSTPTVVTSKGGSAFKVFEPLQLHAVSKELPNNSVELPNTKVEQQVQAIKAALH